jgi:hypothetical protein
MVIVNLADVSLMFQYNHTRTPCPALPCHDFARNICFASLEERRVL